MKEFRERVADSAPDLDWSDARHNRRRYTTEAERVAGYRQRRSMANKRQRAFYKAYRNWLLNPTCACSVCSCRGAILVPTCGFCSMGVHQ